MGQMEAPSSWKIVKLVFLRKPDAEPKKGIRSYRAIALGTRQLEETACGRLEWNKLPTPASKWQQIWCKRTGNGRRTKIRHGSVVRPTMYLASMDIKTAFDEARPRHVPEIMENHDTHGWLIAVLLREMSGL